MVQLLCGLIVTLGFYSETLSSFSRVGGRNLITTMKINSYFRVGRLRIFQYIYLLHWYGNLSTITPVPILELGNIYKASKKKPIYTCNLMVLILQYEFNLHINGIFSLVVTLPAFARFIPTLCGCNNSLICYYFALRRLTFRRSWRKPRHTNYIYMVLPCA